MAFFDGLVNAFDDRFFDDRFDVLGFRNAQTPLLVANGLTEVDQTGRVVFDEFLARFDAWKLSKAFWLLIWSADRYS